MGSMAKSNKSISASEIGSYLYCNRSWGYQRQGIQSANIELFERGNEAHLAHGRQFKMAGRLRLISLILFFLALAAFSIQLIG
jgi:hypothetical protein